MIDTRSELTVFLITVGEPSFADARRALEEQDCKFNLDVIWNVAPMSAAFQQMLERCQTKFYIQVDADMVLKPHAIRTMYEGIKRAEGTRTAMVCWPLFDEHLGRTLLGVKAYQHVIFRNYPYTNTQSCEMDQLGRLRSDGYEIDVEWGEWSSHFGELAREDPRVLGLHGTKYPPRRAFERYKDLIQKARFIGGSDWVFSWPSEFLRRVAPNVNVETSEDFWALMGCVAGLMSPNESRGEKNYREYSTMKDYGEVAAQMVNSVNRLDVYTTSRCNYACTFCSRQRSGKPTAQDFSPAMATKVLDMFPSITSACVAGMGEPLLNPHLAAIAQVFFSRNIYASLITNGALIAERQGIPFEKFGYVNISLNAASPEEHAARCGVQNLYAKALAGMKILLDRGANAGFSFVVDADTYQRIPDFLSISKRHGAKFVSFMNVLPHHQPGNTASARDFRNSVITTQTTGFATALLSYKKQAKDMGVDVWAWPTPLSPNNPRNCRSPFISIGVDGDGNISGCCRVTPPSAKHGNIARGAKLWTELPYLRNLRRQLSGAKDLCYPCTQCFGNWGGGS